MSMELVVEVLVVDDSAVDRQLAGRLIEKQSHLSVGHAADDPHGGALVPGVRSFGQSQISMSPGGDQSRWTDVTNSALCAATRLPFRDPRRCLYGTRGPPCPLIPSPSQS